MECVYKTEKLESSTENRCRILAMAALASVTARLCPMQIFGPPPMELWIQDAKDMRLSYLFRKQESTTMS
ncbi:hypothetical protein R6Q57_025842 [Mikania cordata]